MISDPVVNQIKHFRGRNAGQRFGQTLYNALNFKDGPLDYSEYDKDFHSRLFYITDEELAKALAEWYAFIEQHDTKLKKSVDISGCA